MRRFSVVFALILSVAGVANAQERYPGFGQGDTSPGSPSLPQNLELTVAAGVGVQRDYPGSDDYKAVFAPALDLEYKNSGFLVIDRQSMMTPYEGLGYKWFNTQDFTAGLNLTYDLGRDAQGAITGIGDVDWTALGGVFAAYHPGPFFVRGNLGYDLMNEFGSYKGEFGAGWAGPITQTWRGMIDLSTAFAGDGYAKEFYGVTGTQSAATGGRLAPYTAKGGFYNWGLGATAQYQFTQGIFLQGIMRYDQLMGDAADSPITDSKGMVTGKAMVGYKF